MTRFGWVLLCIELLTAAPAMAEGWNFGGHIKYQYNYTEFRADDISTVYGDNPAHDQGLDLRLKAENRAGPWSFAAHYELLAVAGDTVETRQRLAEAGVPIYGAVNGLPDDSRQLFDLTHDVTDRTRLAAVERIDRLYAGYSGTRQTLRVGRQAISWGNGLVFQPLDFVNPFSPIAIDKEYKTGQDMIYGQWLVGTQDDMQAIVLPRRDPATGHVEGNQSTVAVKYGARFTGVYTDLLVARHFDENIAGVGIVKNVGGAVWRLDVSYTELENGGSATSFVTNVDYSWTWGGKNVYGYLEYFHNGVGESDRALYAEPNTELSERLARGEIFTLAREYTALGLQAELTPLFNFYTNLIANLNDGSKFLQLRGVYDWQQNVQLMAGVNLPSGSLGTEYGGVPVAGTSSFVSAGKSVYLRGAYYF